MSSKRLVLFCADHEIMLGRDDESRFGYCRLCECHPAPQSTYGREMTLEEIHKQEEKEYAARN